MDTVYEDQSYETILLVDTSIHAFNSVNRNALLGDLVAICPPIVGSLEGLAQRDSTSMAI